MRYAIFGVILWALTCAAPAAQAALRCDGRLITEGDHVYDLLKLCGEPDYREEIAGAYLPGVGVVESKERWYYNPGPNSFVRVVDVRAGRVTDIDTASYGFNEETAGDCRPNALRRGMTPLELVARCGPPDYKERRLEVLPRTRRTYGVQQIVVLEEWVYDFGAGSMTRVLTLVDGEVRRIESGRRY